MKDHGMIKVFTPVLLIMLFSICLASDEVLVNTYTDSTQRNPQIDGDDEGNYAIVWNSEERMDDM